jgi:broad specificity phosphatase PhoE
MPTTLYLIRHGAVENPRQVYYGRLPGFGLSAEGLRQAQRAASLLCRVSLAAIYSSPLLRARQTAAPLAAAFPALQVRVSSLLSEVYSPFDGLPSSVLLARSYDVYTGAQAPYEQPADVLRRGLRFVRRALLQYPGQAVAVVTHMDLIQWLALWAKGVPAAVASRARFGELGLPNDFPAPGSVTALVEDGGKYSIL